MITRLLRSILSLLVGLLDRFVKKEDLIVFYVTPRTRWDANQQILYALLSARDRVPVKVVDGNNISRRSPVKSLRVLYQVMRAKVIVFDHSLPPGLTKRHITYNVWHGSPIKKIRYGLPERFSPSFLEYQSSRTDYVLANSDFDGAILAEGLGVAPNAILRIGLPRNDYLTRSLSKIATVDLYDELDDLESIVEGFSTVVLWSPTYRGDSHDDNNPIQLSDDDAAALRAFLEKKNALLLTRYHKFSKGEFNSILAGSANVKDVSCLFNSNLLLRFVDILVTDYSSIWVDFLLLRRPIVLYATDFDEYQKEHGFVGGFDHLVPVPLIDSFEGLLAHLEFLTSSDYSFTPSQRYCEVSSRYFNSQSSGVSELLVDHIERSLLD